MNMATQELRTNAAGVEHITRTATCEDHDQKSSDFLGVTWAGWEFRCKEDKKHMSHRFYAKPPRGVPTTPDEVAAWVEAQRLARINVDVKKAGQ